MAADVPFSATEAGRAQAQGPAATRILPEGVGTDNEPIADVAAGLFAR